MRTTTLRGRAATTLLEVLMAMAIATLVVVGAASHLRTLRQTRDVVVARREALQSARIALDRIARHIRTAREVDKIEFDDDEPKYTLELKDFHGDKHKFENDIGHGEFKYNGKVLAYNTLATFKGYNADGPVPDDEPEKIDAIRVTVTTHMPGTNDSIDLTTFVRLRREVLPGQPRRTTSYATTFLPTTANGLDDESEAFGESDDHWANLETDGGGRYGGFEQGTQTGSIERIFARWRMEFKKGALRAVIRHGGTVLLDTTYSSDDLAHVKDEKRWWWVDLTSLRWTWTDDDIDDLSIEVLDPEGQETEVKLDCLAIDAFFDPLPTGFLWADREGEGDCPAHWDDPQQAFGEPNSSCATGSWPHQDWHGFRVATEESDDEIIAVHVCINAYVSEPMDFEGDLEVRVAKKDDDLDEGVQHIVPNASLASFTAFWNKGNILVDVTNDLEWTWSKLDEYQIRVHLIKRESGSCWLKADAVGWRVLHVAETGRQISSWKER